MPGPNTTLSWETQAEDTGAHFFAAEVIDSGVRTVVYGESAVFVSPHAAPEPMLAVMPTAPGAVAAGAFDFVETAHTADVAPGWDVELDWVADIDDGVYHVDLWAFNADDGWFDVGVGVDVDSGQVAGQFTWDLGNADDGWHTFGAVVFDSGWSTFVLSDVWVNVL